MTPGRQLAGSHFALLLAFFVASGCSALIYEVVWFQQLQLVIGSSAVSLGVLLATFMGGLCLGSLAWPRLVTNLHPLKGYAWIELGIGVCGIAVLFGIPHVQSLYVAWAGDGFSGVLLRGAVCALCLLPPTVLMGASLPAIARWVEAAPGSISWLGWLYGGNTAGAVLGCLFAGFYLLRIHDVATATYTAAALNLLVALAAATLAARSPWQQAGSKLSAPSPVRPAVVFVAIALSGFCALGAEVVWTRLLSLMMGATVYTFALILASVLIGLGLGAAAGAWISRRTDRPRVALGWCQMLLAFSVGWAAYLLAASLPYWPGPAGEAGTWLYFRSSVSRCLLATLPATLLWGASFPFALAAAAEHGGDTAKIMGRVYAANTAGAILGALGFSLAVIPLLGTQGSQRLLIGLSAASGLVALAVGSKNEWQAKPPAPQSAYSWAAAAMAAILIYFVPGIPWGVVAYGRQLPGKTDLGNLLYLDEGMSSSIAISELDGIRMFHVSGKVEASNGGDDMRMQHLLGDLPALLHPRARRVLVVGCGAGVTAGTFVPHPSVERIVICELEARTPATAARYFAKENHGVLSDSRTVVVNDDARHHILTTPEKFDIITSDPIHPWVKGSATLYTREYFELCKRRLNPGGIVVQWVPLYESTVAAVKSQVATFFEAFPEGTIWSNDTMLGEGYDVVLLGRMDSTPINVDELQRRLERLDHVAVLKSLNEVGLGSAVNLLSTYAGRGPDLQRWLRDAEINRDRDLRLQYLAGLGLNLQNADAIYSEMLRYRKYPRTLFEASPEREEALRRGMPGASQ